jgi:hypothetical protein
MPSFLADQVRTAATECTVATISTISFDALPAGGALSAPAAETTSARSTPKTRLFIDRPLRALYDR